MVALALRSDSFGQEAQAIELRGPSGLASVVPSGKRAQHLVTRRLQRLGRAPSIVDAARELLKPGGCGSGPGYFPARRLYCASDRSSSRMYSITASLQPSMCAHAP
jgi:hypothetical protein